MTPEVPMRYRQNFSLAGPAGRCRCGREGPHDCGQAVGLIVIAVVLIAAVAVAMASIAVRMTERSAAQSAADAAALAGVINGMAAADAVAERNGGNLLEFQLDRNGADVTVSVRVQVGVESASARASSGP